MSDDDPYTHPHQGQSGFDPNHLHTDPLRVSYRSGLLTALVTFTALSTALVTLLLAGLITINDVTCGSGLGTPRCGQDGIAARSLVATGVVGLASLITIKVAGSFVSRLRAGAGLIALTIAVGAMTVLVFWLRQDLGLPFPW
ncbi:MAG TPA: hypothetical protein VK095_09765 [Beutenbergiaceae bacterium]|nr:hypothetical protein [Beutenbergiaceae bacterium]